MILTTDRLVLRDFVEEDWPAVLAYQRDPRYLRFYSSNEPTPDEARSFVGRFIAQQAETPRQKYQLAIILQATQHVIGNVGIRMRMLGAHQADIGYELDPQQWGHGYAGEAAREIVRFGFENLRLHRITAHCLAENVASARVLEKLGMLLEGRMRDSEHFKGRYWDTLHYAILEEAWRQRHQLG